MIDKAKFIEEIINFINHKLFDLSSNNPLFDIVVRPYISKIINVNISKLDKALSLITDENGKIDASGLLNDMIDKLIVSNVNSINGLTIENGSIKVNIPFMNKTIIIDKTDFDELKNNIEKYENA